MIRFVVSQEEDVHWSYLGTHCLGIGRIGQGGLLSVPWFEVINTLMFRVDGFFCPVQDANYIWMPCDYAMFARMRYGLWMWLLPVAALDRF